MIILASLIKRRIAGVFSQILMNPLMNKNYCFEYAKMKQALFILEVYFEEIESFDTQVWVYINYIRLQKHKNKLKYINL